MNKEHGLLLVFATALISGFSIFANKFGVSGINSNLYVFARSLLVSAFLISILLLQNQFSALKQLTLKQWRNLALVGLVGGSIPFLLFFRGLQLTSSVSSAFIHKTLFVYVAVLAAFFLKEKVDKRFLLAAILLLGGNYLLLGGLPGELSFGNLLVLSATLLWAVENVLSKHLLKELEGNVLAFGRMFFGALFVLVYLAFTGEVSLVASLSSAQWEWVMASSVILLAYVWTWYNGLKHVSVTAATCILLLGSPITSFLNYAYSGAAITAGQIGGILLLVSGVVGVILTFEKSVTLLQPHTRNV